MKLKNYTIPNTLNIVPIPMLLVIYLLSFTNPLRSQDTLHYPLNTDKVEIGISAGALYTFFADVELTVTINRRVSNATVIVVKPVFGLIRQLYLFDGNGGRYSITYGGATMGACLGRKNSFFEISAGLAYFNSSTEPWGKSTDGLKPVGTLGYKKVGPKTAFRCGIGFPNGIFVGLNF